MMRFIGLLLVLLLAQSSMSWAHEVHHAIEATSAVAIRLNYADGKPFAFEAFEAYPEGKDIPAQVGRTDDQGRAVFVPGETRRWRIKAFSADGHGFDLHIDVPAMTSPPAGVTPTDGPNRASLLLFGFSILLALFGAYQLWSRRKS